MKIANITCENVRGVPSGTYSFAPPGSSRPFEMSLVAGVRGAGKTRLLQAIVALRELVSPHATGVSRRSWLERGATTGRIAGTFVLSEAEMRLAELTAPEVQVSFSLGGEPSEMVPLPVRQLFARYSHDRGVSKLEYFPDSRRLTFFGKANGEADEKRLRPTSAPDKYAALIPALIGLATRDATRAAEETTRHGILLASDAPDSLVPYRKAIAAVVPEVRLGRLAQDEDGAPTLTFARRDAADISARELSSAQAQGVLLAGTMIRLGLAGSIILLDTPELHIHVADHARFLQALMSVESDNQWIVATGSSEIMKNAHRDQVIALPMPR